MKTADQILEEFARRPKPVYADVVATREKDPWWVCGRDIGGDLRAYKGKGEEANENGR